MKKIFSFLFFLVFFAFIGTSCTRLLVIDNKGNNGLKNGHTKNSNNPHHPNTTNPGHTKDKGNGKKN